MRVELLLEVTVLRELVGCMPVLILILVVVVSVGVVLMSPGVFGALSQRTKLSILPVLIPVVVIFFLISILSAFVIFGCFEALRAEGCLIVEEGGIRLAL